MFILFNCEKCGSTYLNEIDAIKCYNGEMEEPLIVIGKILIDTPYYDSKCEIRCCAIKKSGHSLEYCFDWMDESEGDAWTHYHVISNNKHLINVYGEQLT